MDSPVLLASAGLLSEGPFAHLMRAFDCIGRAHSSGPTIASARATGAEAQARPARVQSLDPTGVGFSWHTAPTSVYFQGSASILVGARQVGAPLPIRFPHLAVSPLGVSMWFDAGSPRAEPSSGDRMLPGLVGLAVMFGHPRYAAMRRAAEQARPMSREAFRCFDSRLVAASRGLLDEAGAKALGADLVDHALALSGCSQVVMDGRVHAALRFSDSHDSFCIADLAHRLHLSRSRLSHLFSEQLGFSFRQYVVVARALRAWELVAFEPSLSLTEIAHRIEFSDLAHMSRTFRSTFGLSPSQLRASGMHTIHGRPGVRGERVRPQQVQTPAVAN